MYNKVDTNMNFVDREKETEKFWRENDIFKNPWRTVRKARLTHFMTDRLRQTENHISDM